MIPGFSRFATLLLAIYATANAAIDGLYQGDINGTPATLRLQSQHDQVQGEIDASGYRYVLQGQTDGTNVQGQLYDPQTGAVIQLSLQATETQVTLILVTPGQDLTLQFTRSGADASQPAPERTQPQGQPAGQLDPRLIGRWTANDTMISGDASFVSNSHVTFAADGTYLYQDGAAYAGGSSTWGSTSIESQPAGGGDTGRWRVQGDLLYTRPDAVGQWQLLGRVHIEGNSALVYYPDGSKTLWKRN